VRIWRHSRRSIRRQIAEIYDGVHVALSAQEAGASHRPSVCLTRRSDMPRRTRMPLSSGVERGGRRPLARELWRPRLRAVSAGLRTAAARAASRPARTPAAARDPPRTARAGAVNASRRYFAAASPEEEGRAAGLYPFKARGDPCYGPRAAMRAPNKSATRSTACSTSPTTGAPARAAPRCRTASGDPAHYLEQIFQKLRRAGLVTASAVRGRLSARAAARRDPRSTTSCARCRGTCSRSRSPTRSAAASSPTSSGR